MKITRKFIAEKAGVSATTVSYVVNNTPSARVSDKVRKRVMAVARKYNYMPDVSAKALVTGRTYNIGFLYKSSMSDFISDPFTHEVFVGLEQELEANDYSLMFAMLEKRDKSGISSSAARMMRGSFVDGIILCGDIGPEIIRLLQEVNIPFVLIDYMFKNVACNAVMPDNKNGAYLATDYLITQGCKTIVCLNGDQEKFKHPAYTERPAGYAEAMIENGLQPKLFSLQPDITSSSQAVAGLLQKGDIPDAFFAAGDHIAIGCLNALKSYDESLLEKVRLIGFDDIQWSRNQSPALSTVRAPKAEMGSEAVTLLLESIADRQKAKRVVRIATELVIRDT